MPKKTTAKAPQLNKADFEQLAEFRYQLRRFLRFSEDVTRRHGITMLQYLLLLQVRGYPGRDWANIGELSERLQAKPHGVLALVSRCEALGLVTRRASTSDGRVVEVRLTDKGNRSLTRLAQLHRDELSSLQDKFVVPPRTTTKNSGSPQI